MAKRKSFTLVELLVILAVIGLLANLVMVVSITARTQAKIAKAKVELSELSKAVTMLEIDTNVHPNHISVNPCVQSSNVYLDLCEAGIQCTDGNFNSWKGPYMKAVPTDPWGTYYFFDADYQCRHTAKGCESVPEGTWVRALVSFGPNKTEDYGGDDVVLILCR